MADDPGVLIQRSAALDLMRFVGKSLPPLFLDRQARRIDRAPGAQLCYVTRVASLAGEPTGMATVQLSTCGYNPGDRLQIEVVSEVYGSVPTLGSQCWVTNIHRIGEALSPPHWVILDTTHCDTWYQLLVEGNPDAGSFVVRLAHASGDTDLTIAYNATRAEIASQIATAMSWTHGVGADFQVVGGPLPNGYLEMRLPAGYSLEPVSWSGLHRNGPLIPHIRISSCCK